MAGANRPCCGNPGCRRSRSRCGATRRMAGSGDRCAAGGNPGGRPARPRGHPPDCAKLTRMRSCTSPRSRQAPWRVQDPGRDPRGEQRRDGAPGHGARPHQCASLPVCIHCRGLRRRAFLCDHRIGAGPARLSVRRVQGAGGSGARGRRRARSASCHGGAGLPAHRPGSDHHLRAAGAGRAPARGEARRHPPGQGGQSGCGAGFSGRSRCGARLPAVARSAASPARCTMWPAGSAGD